MGFHLCASLHPPHPPPAGPSAFPGVSVFPGQDSFPLMSLFSEALVTCDLLGLQSQQGHLLGVKSGADTCWVTLLPRPSPTAGSAGWHRAAGPVPGEEADAPEEGGALAVSVTEAWVRCSLETLHPSPTRSGLWPSRAAVIPGLCATLSLKGLRSFRAVLSAPPPHRVILRSGAHSQSPRGPFSTPWQNPHLVQGWKKNGLPCSVVGASGESQLRPPQGPRGKKQLPRQLERPWAASTHPASS